MQYQTNNKFTVKLEKRNSEALSETSFDNFFLARVKYFSQLFEKTFSQTCPSQRPNGVQRTLFKFLVIGYFKARQKCTLALVLGEGGLKS